MGDFYKDSLIEFCDKVLMQMNSIYIKLRFLFEQYSFVYDVICKILEDWLMNFKENNLLKINVSDYLENFTKYIGNEIIKCSFDIN